MNMLSDKRRALIFEQLMHVTEEVIFYGLHGYKKLFPFIVLCYYIKTLLSN